MINNNSHAARLHLHSMNQDDNTQAVEVATITGEIVEVSTRYERANLVNADWVRSQLILKATEAKLLALDRIIKIIPECKRVGELASATKILNELSAATLDPSNERGTLLDQLRSNIITSEDADYVMVDEAKEFLKDREDMASAESTLILNALRQAIKARALLSRDQAFNLDGLIMTQE